MTYAPQPPATPPVPQPAPARSDLPIWVVLAVVGIALFTVLSLLQVITLWPSA